MKRLQKWAMTGVLTFVVEYVIFVIFFGYIQIVTIANFFAASVSLTFNYLLHHTWSFKSKQSKTSTLKRYAINSTFFWVISTLILKFLISNGIDPKIAKTIPILLLMPFTYWSLRKFVYSVT